MTIDANTKGTLDQLEGLEQWVEIVENSYLVSTVNMLCTKMIRVEITTRKLHDEVQQLKRHSMKNNIIFTFDNNKEDGREVEGEDTVSVVR